MKSVKSYMVAFCVLALLHLGTPEAAACSCIPTSIPENIEAAGAIFAGKVTAVKYPDEPKNEFGEQPVIVSVEVSRVWKGEAGKEIVISTVENRSSCMGYNFREGVEYLIFASPAGFTKRAEPGKVPEYRFGVWWCGGTVTLKYASDELKELGEGRPPKQPSGPPSNNGMHPTADSVNSIRKAWPYLSCARRVMPGVRFL